MRTILFTILSGWLLVATVASAQTVAGDRFTLNTGPCTERSGSGSPEGAVTGVVCDTYHQTNSPYDVWRKTSGSGNTGWVKDTTGASGLGAALTKADDTNVTLTLGGSPSTALVNAASLTLGWSGQLSLARGGTNASLTAANGAIPYSTATAFALLAPGAGATLLQSTGAGAPIWTTAQYPTIGTATGSYLRADGANWIASTLKLPNTSTANRVLFSTATDTVGDDADLTFSADTLSATKVASSSLTSGRVPVASTAGLLVDDSDLAFATDTLSATKVTAPTHVKTPLVTTEAATNLSLSPTGDLVTDPTGNDVLPATGYDINLGMLTKKYLSLHAAELVVETLVAQNTIATIGGRVLVAPTNILTTDLLAAQTFITVRYNNFVVGDRVYMEADGKVEFMSIDVDDGSHATGRQYTVTRNLDGTGANDWFAGDALLNTGQTGAGFIDIYSWRGIRAGTEIGPTIVGNVRLSSTFNDWSPRWAIGNLNGLYGYGADTYGTAFGNPAATNITIDAANGIRIRNGTTNKLTADTSGNLSMLGDHSIGADGVFRSVATAFGTGTGIYMDHNGGTPRFRVGNPSGNRVGFDGTNLKVVSANFNADENGVVVTSSSDGTYGSGYTNGYGFTTRRAGTLGLFGSSATTGTIRQGLVAKEDSYSSGAQSELVATTDSEANIARVSAEATTTPRVLLQVFDDSTNTYAVLTKSNFDIGPLGSSTFNVATTTGTLVLGNSTTNHNNTNIAVNYSAALTNGIGVNDTSSTSGGEFMRFAISGTQIGGVARVGATSAVNFNQTSDARLKRDLGPAWDVSGLRALLVHDYTWHGDPSGFVDRNVFAQEAYAAIGRGVTPGDDDPVVVTKRWMVDKTAYVPDLIVGWQQHDATLAGHEAHIRALEARIAQLERSQR